MVVYFHKIILCIIRENTKLLKAVALSSKFKAGPTCYVSGFVKLFYPSCIMIRFCPFGSSCHV